MSQDHDVYMGPTHIIEVLNTDIKELQEIVGKRVAAEENITRKGFKILWKNLTHFLSASSVKVIEEIHSKPLITPLKLMGFFVTLEKSIKIWVWNPSEHVTSYELASLIPYLLTSGTSQPLYEKEINEYLSSWKDHFDIEEIPPQLKNSKEFINLSKRINII